MTTGREKSVHFSPVIHLGRSMTYQLPWPVLDLQIYCIVLTFPLRTFAIRCVVREAVLFKSETERYYALLHTVLLALRG
jgi:hypothetical protein